VAHDDRHWMEVARAEARAVRRRTSPNPAVGAVVLSRHGAPFLGATEPPGGRHAEVVALDEAGSLAEGGTLYVTLEPCSHVGRTAPCTEAIVAAGIERVVVAIEDPDPHVAGSGLSRLREAGIAVELGVGAGEVAEDLCAYLHHRRTGRPLVVLKLAATLDGRTAAADGTSKWITSEAARLDAHELRADVDAIVVGAGTVRADDPELRARLDPPAERQPRRLVLGAIPPGARVEPAESVGGDLGALLDRLGADGVLSLLVEGGADVAHRFVAAQLVDRVVLYLAPALMGGDDGRPVLAGPGAAGIEAIGRGRFLSVRTVGDDLRLEVAI
jgi:diaminohydroxyphosphoribosylaminopyrimidine deaminase / 5-amino-6-(5-phosphoribosylamino)uracil reductase